MQAQSEIETRILGMVAPTAQSMGLDIVRVRVMGRDRPILQIMLERPDGTMDVSACAKFSRAISPLLETEDPISGEYALEVSSPGIDRPLTRLGDFAKWVGHEAKIEIAMPIDGRRRFQGYIVAETAGVVLLKLKDGGESEIPFSAMTKANLVLTDELIDKVQAAGLIMDEETDEDFDDVEVEDDEDFDEDEAPAAASDKKE